MTLQLRTTLPQLWKGRRVPQQLPRLWHHCLLDLDHHHHQQGHQTVESEAAAVLPCPALLPSCPALHCHEENFGPVLCYFINSLRQACSNKRAEWEAQHLTTVALGLRFMVSFALLRGVGGASRQSAQPGCSSGLPVRYALFCLGMAFWPLITALLPLRMALRSLRNPLLLDSFRRRRLSF